MKGLVVYNAAGRVPVRADPGSPFPIRIAHDGGGCHTRDGRHPNCDLPDGSHSGRSSCRAFGKSRLGSAPWHQRRRSDTAVPADRFQTPSHPVNGRRTPHWIDNTNELNRAEGALR